MEFVGQWIDREFIQAHTDGFDEYVAHVAAFPPERAAARSGISVERIAVADTPRRNAVVG